MRLVAVLVLLALAVPSAAPAEPPPSGIVHVRVPPGTSLRDHGAQLYAANCAGCHGSDGRGRLPQETRTSGGLRGAGPSLTSAGALGADLYLRTGYMPLAEAGDQPRRSRVLFSERELDALVAYVASLGHGPPVPRPHPERGSLSEGLSAFTDRCAGCHQVVAAGGYVKGAVVPSLGDATPVQVAEAVRTGPYLMPRFSPKAISEHELDSIIRYVEYTQHPDDRGGFGLGHVGPVPEGLVTWLVAGALLVGACMLFGRRLPRP